MRTVWDIITIFDILFCQDSNFSQMIEIPAVPCPVFDRVGFLRLTSDVNSGVHGRFFFRLPTLAREDFVQQRLI